MLQAIKTRILPGRDKQGRYRVSVFAQGGVGHRIIHVEDIFGEEHAHKEAARIAIKSLNDGWQGDYVGGMFHGDGVWVQLHRNTPHTSAVSISAATIDWTGGMP